MSNADYTLLGLRPGASAAEARAAYRRLALTLHPDKSDAPDAAPRFLAVKAAFEAIVLSGERGAEAAELLRDPLADLFGEGWARGFADGSLDPAAVFEQAKHRSAALSGGADPLAEAAAEFGLEAGPDDLAAMLAASGMGGGADGPDGADGANVFKEFFDAMPEAERGPMMALFEKTFPAFLANEMASDHLDVENALFERAVQSGSLPRGGAADEPEGPQGDAQARAEALNAEAVGAFGEGRYGAAAEALAAAIALDGSNPAFYGNRSLALERAGRYEEALGDAERALRCDVTYAAAYERKGRALLGLGLCAEARAAAARGLILAPDAASMAELHDEASARASEAQIGIVRAGKGAIDAADDEDAAGRVRPALRG